MQKVALKRWYMLCNVKYYTVVSLLIRPSSLSRSSGHMQEVWWEGEVKMQEHSLYNSTTIYLYAIVSVDSVTQFQAVGLISKLFKCRIDIWEFTAWPSLANRLLNGGTETDHDFIFCLCNKIPKIHFIVIIMGNWISNRCYSLYYFTILFTF